MVSRIIADRAHDFQHPDASRLPFANCGQNQGSKKTAETDAIFENVWQMNALADADPETMRISIDTKATVNVGEYSRGGRSRGVEAVKVPRAA